MKLTHPNITSSLFELVKTYEVDLALGNDTFSARIELFRSLSDPRLFRYRSWRDEPFKIRPSFPEDRVVKSEHGPSNEVILIELMLPRFGSDDNFYADDSSDALSKILTDLNMSLVHMTGIELKIFLDDK